MSVRIVRLKNGEDVISDIYEVTSNADGEDEKDKTPVAYQLRYPHSIFIRSGMNIDVDGGNIQKLSDPEVVMEPWLPLSKNPYIFFRIDEVVTVTGQLESIEGTTTVKTPSGGKVERTYFKDGQSVKKGDLLVRFDTRQAKKEKGTIESLLKIEKQDALEEQSIYTNSLALLGKKIEYKKMILEDLEKLAKQGGFQKIQLLEQREQLIELKSQLEDLKLKQSRSKLRYEKSKGQMLNRLNSINLKLLYQNIKAPVSGIIFEPKANAGGVFQSGDEILTIVPQGKLKASIFVPNKDIGFVESGQLAKIRVDAFPFTRYGELEGKVVQVAADALPPDEKQSFYRYPVKLDLKKDYLTVDSRKIPLRSGMAITANLKLREKRVISLLSDMLVDQTESVKSLRQQ